MTVYVLDTNIISLIMRQHPTVRARFDAALGPQNDFLGCPVVWYEVRRGLLARDARNQIADFEFLFSTFLWQDYTQADWTLAASLWMQRRSQGLPIGDADLLIAVFARNRGAVLVTDNEKDFAGLGVTVDNWMVPAG